MTMVSPRREDPTPFRKEAPLPIAPGNSFMRLITARAVAAVVGGDAADVVAALWPNDRTVQRAASAPAMTSVTGWAKELAAILVADALAALGAASAGARLLRQGTVLNWDGAGLISCPGFVADSANAGFVAEGAPIAVKQLTAGAGLMEPHKLASIAVLTREMMESSNAETLIGDTLIRSAALALDVVLFDSNAETAVRPEGLRHSIATLTASNNSDGWLAAFEDLGALLNAVGTVGGAGPFVLIGNAGRVGTFTARLGRQGEPNENILASSAVGNDLIAVAPAGLAVAMSPDPAIETSKAATLHMEGSSPAAIVNGGSPASPQRSVFQTDSIALKMRWPVTWVRRDARAVAWLTPTWK